MKLLSINIGIKIDNTDKIATFIKQVNPDVIAIQEIIRHQENTVFPQYRSQYELEQAIGNNYPHRFFGPLWITDAIRKNGQIHRDFGGLVEQGNEILSKFPILEATNEHYYKHYAYARDWTNWRKEDHGRALQVVEIHIAGRPLQILTIHGIWTEDKLGDQRTIDECIYVVHAAKRKNIPTLIAGDFNLLPETESITMIEKHFRNLITEYHIKTTRPRFDDGLETGGQVVDYIFVNEGIKVNNFEVITTDVSDHYPLLLDFDLA